MIRVLWAGNTWMCFVVLAVLTFPIFTNGEDTQDLLAVVKAAQQSARDSVRTLSCTVMVDERIPSFQRTLTGKYWRSTEVARVELETPTGVSDWYYLYKLSEVRNVVRNRPGTDQPLWLAGRQPIDEGPAAFDVWQRMFLQFEYFLELAKTTVRAKRVRLDERDCIQVTMDISPRTKKTFSFDATRGYIVWKCTEISKDHHTEIENLAFLESQPGSFFPTKLISKSFTGSEQTNQVSVTLADVRINEPIGNEVLQIPGIPSGTICYDRIKKQRYPIHGNWEPISGGKVEPIEYIPLPSPSASSGEGTKFTSQSVAEPRSWTRWIAWGSLTTLFLCWRRGSTDDIASVHTRNLKNLRQHKKNSTCGVPPAHAALGWQRNLARA